MLLDVFDGAVRKIIVNVFVRRRILRQRAGLVPRGEELARRVLSRWSRVVPPANDEIETMVLGNVGRMPHVPLAEKRRRIAGILHRLAQRIVIQGEVVKRRGSGRALIRTRGGLLFVLRAPTGVPRGRGKSNPRRILAGHDACPGGTTKRIGRVGIREAHATCRQPVHVGCLVERAAVTPRILPAEVVDHDKKHIWSVRERTSDHQQTTQNTQSNPFQSQPILPG